MNKMVLATGLFMACFGSISARSMTVQEAQDKKFNLKHHQKQIAAYYAKVSNKASLELRAVVKGMNDGNYMYDLDTARAVMREVYAHRMPQPPKNIER